MGLLSGGSQAKGYKQAEGLYKKIGEQASVTQEKIDPYSEYRQTMADTLYGYVTGTKSIQTDPGYQFTMNQAMQETQRAASAKGYGRSGNVMAALQQRASDVASQQYSSIIERLTNLAGAGSQNAIAGGQVYGNMMETSLSGQAAAKVGQAQAKSSGLSGLGSLAGAGVGYLLGGKQGMGTGSGIGGMIGGML